MTRIWPTSTPATSTTVRRDAKAVRLIQGHLFAVVYTVRGGVTRIISARQSNAMEKRRYAEG
jgi:uncharacterized DUF497 family protein